MRRVREGHGGEGKPKILHPAAPRCAGIDSLDEVAGSGCGAIDAAWLHEMVADMDNLLRLPCFGDLGLADDTSVPEPRMVRADVANEGQRSDPAHQRIGEQAVAFGDGGTIIGVGHFEQSGARTEIPGFYRHLDRHGRTVGRQKFQHPIVLRAGDGLVGLGQPARMPLTALHGMIGALRVRCAGSRCVQTLRLPGACARSTRSATSIRFSASRKRRRNCLSNR